MNEETLWKIVAASAQAAAIIVGAFIAYAGVRAANTLKKLEQDVKNRELVKSSLEFLTGGTQKRTVGITLLKDLVEKDMIGKNIATTILRGQAEHLKDTNNKEPGRLIEKYNLEEIETLLNEWRAD